MQKLIGSLLILQVLAVCSVSKAQTDVLEKLGIDEQAREVKFQYALGSLKPKKQEVSMAGYGDMGGSMEMGGGMDMGGMGMGPGMGMGGGYGGESEGTVDGGEVDNDPTETFTIYAYLLKKAPTASRTSIELLFSTDELVKPKNKSGMWSDEGYFNPGTAGGPAGGYGGEAGYGGGVSSYGGEGYGGGSYGGGGYGGEQYVGRFRDVRCARI